MGWSIDASPTGALVTNALGMALDPRPDKHAEPGAIIHSDYGVQFGSWPFTKPVKDFGLLTSMGSIGDYYDNSMTESFWLRIHVALPDRKRTEPPFEPTNAM